MKNKFIKGLKLNEGYYFDVVKPLIEKNYGNLRYSAGLIGYGSDVLGYDTHISTDHNWGPRMIIFLSNDDIGVYKDKLDSLLKKNLPYEYKGFSTNFSNPGDDGTVRMEYKCEGEINHLIEIMTIDEFLKSLVGVDDIDNISLIDWLSFNDQGLIEITKGKVFYDGLGVLNKVREFFRFLPKDILRLKLAAMWNHISSEEAFVGRNIDLGEDLGARIISSRIVNTLIKVCFYIEGEYIPYSKWFTIGFRDLKSYETMNGIFTEILACDDISKLEKLICRAYIEVIDMQNKLELTDNIGLNVVDYYGRPYSVVYTDKVVDTLIDSIDNEKLRNVNLDLLSLIYSGDGIDLTDNKELLKNIFKR